MKASHEYILLLPPPQTAFYQNALAAVKEGRTRLATHKVPYKRPDDFFCDMLKSDEHMARVSKPLLSLCLCVFIVGMTSSSLHPPSSAPLYIDQGSSIIRTKEDCCSRRT